jgi:translocation and assembly module TamA
MIVSLRLRFFWCLLVFVAIVPFAYGAKKNSAAISYKVKFSYNIPPKILDELQESSRLVEMQNRPVQSIAALHYRAEKDTGPLLEVLYSYGYYDAEIRNTLSEIAHNSVEVQIDITLKDQYRLSEFKIVNAQAPNSTHIEIENAALEKITLNRLKLEIGQPADASSILSAERQVIYFLQRAGYPEAHLVDKKSTADRTKQTVSVTMYVDTGPYAYFGPICIEGLHRVKPEYARYLLSFHENEPYDLGQVQQTQSTYFDTSLFSYVEITHPENVHTNERMPMRVSVKESKQRSFSIGGNYATLDGFGGTIGWEHRNFRGLGQRLSFQANISKRFKDIVASYREPNLSKKGRFRSWKLESSTQNYKSFGAKSVALYRRYDTNVNRQFKRSTGWTLEYLRDTTNYSSGHYTLLKAPIFFRYATTKDTLNPTRGFEANLGLTSTINLPNPDLFYLKTRLSYALYIPLSPTRKSCLAARAYLGSIIGANLFSVPAAKRFYAGTDQFLRGYDYFTVSPLNSDNDPTGGKCMLMFNVEMRFQANEDFGFVLFYDTGQVYAESYIRFREKFLRSVGFGIRYFSILGPLSVDIAFPIDRRPGYEESLLKLYVSIGQTF